MGIVPVYKTQAIFQDHPEGKSFKQEKNNIKTTTVNFHKVVQNLEWELHRYIRLNLFLGVTEREKRETTTKTLF